MILVLVAVTLQVVVVGLHARIEEIGLAYHYPIKFGRVGKLCLVLCLQLVIER